MFCRDFKIQLPKSKIQECYKGVSINKMPLSLEQFKLLIPILGEVFLRSKVEEIKCRLREIK